MIKFGRFNPGEILMHLKPYISMILIMGLMAGCSGQSKEVRKIAKPVDQTAAELVKVREIKSESGETRAVVSPADQKQLKITF